MSLDLHAHFTIFRDAAPDRIHLAAHSHHYWPDAACRAHEKAAHEAARLADRKWDSVFEDLMPLVRRGIARILNLPDPASIAFASNTHDLVCRLLSALPLAKPRILTSDGEFHSFARQIARLEEEGLVEVERIATEPASSFPNRFCKAARAGGHDLVFVSHVFFNSGATCGDIGAVVKAVASPQTLIAIDGYHAFCALPADLSGVASRVFYLAGGYKYAMSGEGACFMHCPPGYAKRPRDTGWFAGFGALSTDGGKTAYGADGSRFLGATFDPSGLYRMAAVFAWMDRIELTVAAIHDHVLALQQQFLDAVQKHGIAPLQKARLVTPMNTLQHGHFLSFETAEAALLQEQLAKASIVTDVRGDHIRFGFGCYHTKNDIAAAALAIQRALA